MSDDSAVEAVVTGGDTELSVKNENLEEDVASGDTVADNVNAVAVEETVAVAKTEDVDEETGEAESEQEATGNGQADAMEVETNETSTVHVGELREDDAIVVLEEDDDDADDSGGDEEVGVKGIEEGHQEGEQSSDDNCVDSGTSACKHAAENQLLREALLDLSERQAILEEFLEVDSGEKFSKFLTQRERLVDVMGLNRESSDFDKFGGKRTSRSTELVGLLKLIKDQANPSTANGTSSSDASKNTQNKSSQERSNNQSRSGSSQLSSGQSNKRGPSGGSSNSPTKKLRKTCICCYMTDHMIEQCPYRGRRAPEVQKEISKRRKEYFSAYNNVTRGNQRR